MPAVTCRFFVGIDWGTETHHVCVLNVDAQIVEERRVQHTASDIAEFLDWLSGLAPDFSASMAIAIELPNGTLVEELPERQFRVFSLNPKQLDRFRDRYFPAGAKDDGRDAFVLAYALRTDQYCFRVVRLGDPSVVRLRELTRLDEELNFCFQRHCCQLRQHSVATILTCFNSLELPTSRGFGRSSSWRPRPPKRPNSLQNALRSSFANGTSGALMRSRL